MLFIYLIAVIACMIAIWKISDIFEDATGYLGRNMSDGIRGASLNAIGSSMPELMTSFIFLFFLTGSAGYEGTIGTTAGSAVFNSLLIPAAVIIVVFAYGVIQNKSEGIQLSPASVRRDGIFLLISEVALIMVISTNTITWYDGAILIALYLVYATVLYMQNKSNTNEHIPGTPEETQMAWLNLIGSTIMMTVICFGLVYAVEQIGEIMDVPLIFVSIILAAAASSVPDTIISIKDGLAGEYDDAVSNALGSNIFDILIAHGLPLTIYILMYGPIVMDEAATQNSIELRISLIVITAIAVLIYVLNKKIFVRHGYYFIGLYLIFIGYTVSRAMGYNILGLW